MLRQVRVFLDIPSQYAALRSSQPKSRIDYERLIDFLRGEFRDVIIHAYGTQRDQEAEPFIKTLRQFCTTIKYNKALIIEGKSYIALTDRIAAMTMDALKFAPRSDCMVFASSDDRLIDTIAYLRAQGVIIILCTVKASQHLIDACDQFLPIPENCIEQRTAANLA